MRRAPLVLIGVVAVLVIGLLVMPALLLVHRTDLPFERGYANVVVSLVARVAAGDAKLPANARSSTAGRYAYIGSCATCHGATGDGKGVFGQSTYPPSTDLANDAKGLTDAELFWITKNGLSFTAMPGFGRQYSDADLWAIVGYVRTLQSGGRINTIKIPTPTEAQLAVADPFGSATARGAAVYFAQGCQLCHGAVGNAPGDLALREGDAETVRRGKNGMPAYGTDRVSAAQLSDLLAYMRTFRGGGGVPGD